MVTSLLPNEPERDQINSVRVFRVKTPNRYLFTFLAIPTLLQLAKHYDVISTTTYNGAFPAWLVSKIYRKPCIITVHELFGKLWGDFQSMGKLMAFIHRILENLIIKLPFTKYVGVSNFTEKQIQSHGKKNTVTIYNGIDYEHFNPQNYDRDKFRRDWGLKNSWVYLCYGRPGISKGIEYLIRAVPEISRQIPKSILMLILGLEPVDMREKILKLMAELEIGTRIYLLPPVPYSDLPKYIIGADCVVIPSLQEGFGFSAAEACAMGKTVVASNAGALPEVLWGNFILALPQNPDSIAGCVVKAYKNDFSKEFSWDKCVSSYEKIYSELAWK